MGDETLLCKGGNRLHHNQGPAAAEMPSFQLYNADLPIETGEFEASETQANEYEDSS